MGMSAWNTDNNYLYSLYQGDDLGEEQSVIGEIDKDKISVTATRVLAVGFAPWLRRINL